MHVPVSEAKRRLSELIRRAEAGEEVALTRDGQAIVRLVPVRAKIDRAERRALMEAISADGAARALPGPDAARSQDFLYDEYGLPK